MKLSTPPEISHRKSTMKNGDFPLYHCAQDKTRSQSSSTSEKRKIRNDWTAVLSYSALLIFLRRLKWKKIE